MKKRQYNNFSVIGTSGLRTQGGRIYEQDIHDLQGLQKYTIFRKMRYYNSLISSFFMLMKVVARNVDWYVKLPDKITGSERRAEKQREFIEQCLDELDRPFGMYVDSWLDFVWQGFGLHFIEYEYRNRENSDYPDGKIKWRRFLPRRAETICEWTFDEHGVPKGFIQYDNYSGKKFPEVSLERVLHFRTDSDLDNPEGRSVLESLYWDWKHYLNILEFQGIAIEKDATGTLMVGLIPDALKDPCPAEYSNLLDQVRTIVRNFRNDSESGIIYPIIKDEAGNDLFKIDVIHSAGKKMVDTNVVIKAYEERILRTLMAQALAMGGTQQYGSLALMSGHTDLLAMALAWCLDVIKDVFNKYAIPRLLRLNGQPTKNAPRLDHTDFEKLEIKSVGGYLASLRNIWDVLNPTQKNYALEQVGFPLFDLDEEIPEVSTVTTTPSNPVEEEPPPEDDEQLTDNNEDDTEEEDDDE